MSKRMKLGNKLLLKVNNDPIIIKTIRNIIRADFNAVYLVLGHQEKLINNIITGLNIKTCYNKNYKNGLSSSIVTGIKKCEKESDGAMICLGDMPSISKKVYNHMLKIFDRKYIKNEPLIVAPIYNKFYGNPILFSKHFFNKLKKIKGDKGAKEIVTTSKEYIVETHIKDKSILTDIDDEKTYNQLILNEKK